MEWEKVWGSIRIGSIGMNTFLKYVHAEAFLCNIYACTCVCMCKISAYTCPSKGQKFKPLQ